MNTIRNYRQLLLLMVILEIVIPSCGQSDPVSLKLSVASKGPVNDMGVSNNLLLSIGLVSNSSQEVKIPNQENFFVFEGNAPFADGYFEVRSATPDGKDNVVAVTNDCDHLVPDSVAHERTVILSKKQSFTYSYNLGCYYQFMHNQEYHIRLCYRLSKLNPMKDVYSNWLIVKF